MLDGGVLISEPQCAANQAYDMIRLDSMRKQMQPKLNDRVGSIVYRK